MPESVARLRHAGGRLARLLIGEDRKWLPEGQNGAFGIRLRNWPTLSDGSWQSAGGRIAARLWGRIVRLHDRGWPFGATRCS